MSTYKINRTKTVAKLRILTDEDLKFLADVVDAEHIRRQHQAQLNHASMIDRGLKSLVRTTKTVRSLTKPTRKLPPATIERPTVRTLGDPDGDVLWKHHGVTESEAYDAMHDMDA
jgi:hypothetical protein